MRISTALPLFLSASLAVAAPLVDLTKRQYCASGSTVCAAFCCLPGESCVYDASTASGFNCKPAGDPNYQVVTAAVFTYTVNPNPTVVVVSIGGGANVTPGVTPLPTPGITPGNNTPGNTPGYTPGNTPGNTATGTLIPPTQPTGTITQNPGTTTGSFITAIPTGTNGVPVPVPVTSGGGGLTAGQIGGIIGGVIGGLGLLGLLLLWCCLYGICAAFGGRSHSSDSSHEERKTWKSYIPLALAGGAFAANRHRHSHHSTTTVTTEKKHGGGGGVGKALLGGLGAAWLVSKFTKEKKHEYKQPKYQGAVAGAYTHGTSSYTGSSSTSSTSRSYSDTSSSYFSHSSSSSGFASNDSRVPPPARAPPPRRHRY